MAIRYVDIPPEDGKARKVPKPGAAPLAAPPAEPAPPSSAGDGPDGAAPAAGKAKRKRK